MKRERICGVYLITTPSGKMYVGSAIDVHRRWQKHRSDLKCGRHANAALQNSHDKYGLAALRFELLRECSIDEQFAIEQSYIDVLPAATRLNFAMTAGGGSGPKSASTREKMRAAQLGRKRTPEQIEAMRERQIGYVASPETRAKIGAANMGSSRTAATRARMSVARKAGRTGLKGVERHGAKWRAIVTDRQTKRRIGSYATPELAYAMRLVYLAALPPGGV